MFALALALAVSAFAQDPTAPTEAAEVPEAAEAPEAPAQASPPAVAFSVGRVNFESSRKATAPALVLDACALGAPPLPHTDAGPQDGQLLLELVFKKGKVSLVSVARTDPGLDWVTPCLKRELAAVDWSIRKGRAEVPVTVTQSESATPAPDAP